MYNTQIGSLLLNVSILGSSSHLTRISTFPCGENLFGRMGELRPRARGLRGLLTVGLGGQRGVLWKLSFLRIFATSFSQSDELDTCIIVEHGEGSRLSDPSSAESIASTGLQDQDNNLSSTIISKVAVHSCNE